ncbi:helix-turn-helix domain-containing protein [Saccharothrix sp.]|uniref:helix-turn-helix domain-containing protein n=1 Tax=Saccharothrix sp. TaxID=1873460 RepID=UPI0035C82B7B
MSRGGELSNLWSVEVSSGDGRRHSGPPADSGDEGDISVNSSVVARTFRILQLFIVDSAMTLTEISKAAELPKATAHRYATDLVKVGALRRLDDSRFSTGPVWARLRGDCTEGSQPE